MVKNVSKQETSKGDRFDNYFGDEFDDNDDFVSDDKFSNFNNFDGDGDYFGESKKMDSESLKIRIDPQDLLHRFRLQLLNAYEVQIKEKDKSGVVRIVKKVKTRGNVTPTCNKQGVSEIINYLEKYINTHVVLGNLVNEDAFNSAMKEASMDITGYFISKRLDWDMSINNVDGLISSSVNLVHFYITRLLQDRERGHLSEGFKEVTHKNFGENKDKGFFEKVAGFFTGNKNNNNGGGWS